MSAAAEIVLIGVVTAVAASIPGTYLVLRRTAMVSDAISHAILPGIVVAFFITHDLNSPLLLVAAAATGVLTVVLIEALRKTRLVPEDASIGLVFPALFSVGVILISRYAGDVHLDTDSVLLGELAFAPFDRMIVNGLELHTQFLVGWADKLDSLIYKNSNDKCGFTAECWMGWEADLAIRAKMGAKDVVWIDLETGMMQPGQAFKNAGINDAWLWTAQLRAAMIF